MEEGELDIEEGEVAHEVTPQPGKPAIPAPPEPSSHEESLMQRKPKKAKLSKVVTAGYHDVYGNQARAEVQMYGPGAIRLLDVQGLLLWILADGMNPRWCFVKNKALVRKVVIIGMPGLEAELFKTKQEFMPIMHSQLGTPATVLAKNAQVATGSTLNTLLTVPFSKKRKRDSDDLRRHTKTSQSQNGRPLSPSHYAVSLEQMQANKYPLPEVTNDGQMTCPAGFVATQPAGDKAPLDMVSVDCEMCVTAAGYELTRVSLVDSQGQVLMDELVVPENAITDYNTQYSGITAQALADVTTSLADIQKQVCAFVSAETMLVGHGLENDLAALKIIHANCMDTALMFPHPKGPPAKPALRILAQQYLKRAIQQAEHDSVVDARAALDLTKLKIAKGPAFGTYAREEQGDRLMDVLHAHKRRCTLIDRTDMLNRHVTGGASAIIATADEEAVQKACKEAANENTDFVWTQLRALGSFLGIRAQHKKQQYALQQQPQQQPQQQQPTSPNHGMSQAAAGPDGKGTSEQPDKGNAIPARRQQSQAMAQDVQRAVNGAMANGKNAQHNSSACGGDANPADPANADAKSAPSTLEQNGRASHEQAASTTEEHTEEHKYVKTEQDEAGNQQAKAEVVQKSTTTQVKKRKRVEQSSAGRDGNGNAVQAGASPSDPNQAMPDASGQASPGQASKVGEQQLANGNGKVLEDQKPSPAAPEWDLHSASTPTSPFEQTQASPSQPSASPQSQSQDVSEEQLDRILKDLDDAVGRVIEALPVNGMLVVFTCQGDTAEYRRMQEYKTRAQQGLDKLLPWTLANEAELASTASRVCRALCFASVKQ